MVALRCTAKLLRRLRLPSRPPSPPPSTTLLGDWYATLLYTRYARYILCASQHGLLPLVFYARALDRLPEHLERHLADLLSALVVPSRLIERELSAMRPIAFGATLNRSLLASMNDYQRIFRRDVEDYPEFTLLEYSLRLAEAPMGYLDMESPKRVVSTLLRRGPAPL